MTTVKQDLQIDEDEAIQACLNGKLEKFSLLYEKYAQKIYSFVYYKTFCRETAEDITSTSFMKALDKIKSYDKGKGSFSSWLYRIAYNSVIDHYRKKKHHADIDEVWDLDSGEDIAADAAEKESSEELRSYIAKLPEEKREVLIMRVWQQMSFKEIAETTGKSEANCKMTFHRLLKKMKKELPAELFSLIIAAVNAIYAINQGGLQ